MQLSPLSFRAVRFLSAFVECCFVVVTRGFMQWVDVLELCWAPDILGIHGTSTQLWGPYRSKEWEHRVEHTAIDEI